MDEDLLIRERAHIDANTSRCSSPQWCLAISVVEITIAALEDVWEPIANVSSVDEENWELKRGILDVAAIVDIVGWKPSHLGYNSAFSCPAEVQR